jgi:hypothetical protein
MGAFLAGPRAPGGMSGTTESPTPQGEESNGALDASSVKLVIELVTAVAAPAAAFSALMVYFGWVRTRALFGYFGVDVAILRFSTTDFVLRSSEVFFKPAVFSIVAVGAVCIVAMGVDFVDRRTRTKHPYIVHLLLWLGIAITLLYGVLGLINVVRTPYAAATALALSGALLLIWQRVRSKRNRNHEQSYLVVISAFVLVTAAAFWMVSVYAQNVGTGIAESIVRGLNPRPIAVIYSKADLQIAGGQKLSTAPSDEEPWRFRYTGYKVLSYANDRWILIRMSWQPTFPTVILPDDGSVRVDVHPGVPNI